MRANRARANRARAAFAEHRVAAWYERAGYTIVARNWRCPRGELDVVAWRSGVLVVCEVKARRNANFGDPFEAITPRKILKLRRATAAFIEALGARRRTSSDCSFFVNEVRFDAAAVMNGHVEVRIGVA